MSNFKVGDRVRVTYEGVIEAKHSDSDLWDVRSDARRLICSGPDHMEKLKTPLPATPGSVIRAEIPSGDYHLYALYEDGRWRGWTGPFDFDVIHDAGVVQSPSPKDE